MQRKIFLQLTAFTATAIALPFLTACDKKENDEAQPAFFSQIAEKGSIINTGIAYRAVYPWENNKDTLKRLLLLESGLPASASRGQISGSLSGKVESDFKTGKVLVVNGWVLSLTEARQCALFSILQQ
jgi:hypothetical protein